MSTQESLEARPGAGERKDVEQAWRELEAAWDDDAAHRRFIALCQFQGALAEAGRRYRAVQDRDPTRREEARRRLGAVLAAALSTLELARAQPAARRTRLFWAACGVCLGLCVYALLAAFRMFTR